MLALERCWLCSEDHLTASSTQCDCGSRALVSLASILNRQPVAQQLYEHESYQGICSSLPTIQRLMEEN